MTNASVFALVIGSNISGHVIWDGDEWQAVPELYPESQGPLHVGPGDNATLTLRQWLLPVVAKALIERRSGIKLNFNGVTISIEGRGSLSHRVAESKFPTNSVNTESSVN